MFGNFLDSLTSNSEIKMAKLVRLTVVFLLKLKSFHTNLDIKKSVLGLTVSLCRIFPLTPNSLDQINQVLGLLPALNPLPTDVLVCCTAILEC